MVKSVWIQWRTLSVEQLYMLCFGAGGWIHLQAWTNGCLFCALAPRCWFSVDSRCYWFFELDGYKEYGVWLIINQEMYPLYIHIMITSKVNQRENNICMTIVQMWQTAWCVLALCQKMNVDRCYEYLFYPKYNTGFKVPIYISGCNVLFCSNLWECFEVCIFVQIKNESCNIVQ